MDQQFRQRRRNDRSCVPPPGEQEQPYDLWPVLDQITNGNGYYFFDLDLTPKEAQSLGYPLDAPVLYSSQRHQTLERSQFHVN
jgi:hypothetical protein